MAITDSWRMIETSSPFTIEGFTIDGNRSGQAVTSWKRNRHIQGYEGLVVRNNLFMELSSDGVDAFGGDSIIEGNTFYGTDASAIHLSNDLVEDGDVLITGNRFIETNQKAVLAGHSEGAITISVRNNHVRVINNLGQDIDRPLIGSFHVQMSDWTIDNNVVLAVGGLFDGKENNNGPEPLSDVTVTNNRVFDSGMTEMNTRLPVESFVLSDNHFFGSPLRIVDTSGTVSGNVFQCSPLAIIRSDLDLVDNLEFDDCGPYYLDGDADLNGDVDTSDFNIWNKNRGLFPATWMDGDFNGDRIVDVSDFNIWNVNKFTSLPRAVPESGSILFLYGCAMFVLRSLQRGGSQLAIRHS